MSDISPLSSLINLEELEFEECNISNIEPLKGTIYINELNLHGNKNLSDISVLSNLINLRILRLGETKVKNFEPVSGIKYLNLFKP